MAFQAEPGTREGIVEKGIPGGAGNEGGKRGDFQTAIERFGDAKLYVGNALMCIGNAKL